jgi:hypothetical protein
VRSPCPRTRTFADIVEAVDQLTPDEQETLITLVRRRLAHQGRLRILADVEESRRKYERGECKAGTVDEIMKRMLS